MNCIQIRNITINLDEVQYVDWSDDRCRVKFRGEINPKEIPGLMQHDRERLNAAMQKLPQWPVMPHRWWYHLGTVWSLVICVMIMLYAIFGFRR